MVIFTHDVPKVVLLVGGCNFIIPIARLGGQVGVLKVRQCIFTLVIYTVILWNISYS